MDELCEGAEFENGPEADWSAKMLEETEVPYSIRSKTAFVISGPLYPFKRGEVTCGTTRQFESVQEAEKWARAFYPKVYENLSRHNVWAFLVEPRIKSSGDK